ncbi:MAG: Mobile element protein [Candidatus Fermentimicrarchaeum limneticum]|uniref:Mobile element protein n=1 Tax=Fermentimicrarchaeum limneticum TaxID=2795018 RepID=A0A7D6BR71_FERL1|nr:MAG: Mobile element protein [Candidatus Fermentimicrarchaeum limneticum]
MHGHLWISKNLWNKLLEANKKKYEEEKKFIPKSEMQRMVKECGLYSQTAQVLSHRLYNSIKMKVKAKNEGKKTGFPRFKSFERMKSLHYPQFGFSLENKLKITPFGEIAIKKHREITGRIKTLTLKRESSGKWFAIFTVEQGKQQPKINGGEAVGIDLGLKNFVTFSNGKIIQNPRHLKRWEDKLVFIQRELSKKKKGGSNRKKAKVRVAKLHEKIADCRRDFLHKISTELVNDYSIIALEKLASKEMSEENYGKQIRDAGWNMFANMLAYKAEGAGCKVVFVDPRNTTKECSSCGALVDKTLRDRAHNCPFCGLSIDRDLNAARVILIRATEGHSGSNACNSLQKERDAAIATSVKQEALIL